MPFQRIYDLASRGNCLIHLRRRHDALAAFDRTLSNANLGRLFHRAAQKRLIVLARWSGW